MQGKRANNIVFDDLEIQTKQWEIAKQLQHLPLVLPAELRETKPEDTASKIKALLTEEDLLAYKADNDLLAAVWELRYGDAWVRVEDLAEEGFMVAALLKLLRETNWVNTRRMNVEPLKGNYTLVHTTVRTYATEDGVQHTFLNPTVYQVKAPCK
jgi:hypothetical protein